MNFSDMNQRQNSLALTKLAQIKRLCMEKDVPSEIVEALDEFEKILLQDAAAGGREMSAQLSIYPLRQASLSPTINAALTLLGSYGIKVIPGSMSTLVIGQTDQVWGALKKVYFEISSHGEIVMIVTFSNACPKPSCEDR